MDVPNNQIVPNIQMDIIIIMENQYMPAAQSVVSPDEFRQKNIFRVGDQGTQQVGVEDIPR